MCGRMCACIYIQCTHVGVRECRWFRNCISVIYTLVRSLSALRFSVINGEKAAFNTPVFAEKRHRTLEMLIRSLYQEHMPECNKVRVKLCSVKHFIFPRSQLRCVLFYNRILLPLGSSPL